MPLRNFLASHFLASLGAHVQPDITYPCCDKLLKAVKTGYPMTSVTLPYHRLRYWPIKVKYFFEVIHWPVNSFQMIAGSSSVFLKCIGNKLCLWATLLKFWFQTDLRRENSASHYRQGRQSLLTFLTMVMCWSCSPSNFYTLIGQNLIGGLWVHAENLCCIWKLVYW